MLNNPRDLCRDVEANFRLYIFAIVSSPNQNMTTKMRETGTLCTTLCSSFCTCSLTHT